MKKTTLPITNSISCPPLRRVFVIIAFASFALSRAVQAQLSPPPDGFYFNGNTAEGFEALFSVKTGSNNTAMGFQSLFFNNSSNNTAYGFQALITNTMGSDNTATGFGALLRNTDGANNTATGIDALLTNSMGSANTATGAFALFNTTGDGNTAEGSFALFGNTGGSSNIAVGEAAGINLTTGDDNIDIGNQGVAGETKTIRIGTQGTQTRTFIAGITGVNEGTPTAVFINTTTGQLGTTAPTSSARFKKEIKPMDKASAAILAFKPVTFKYKSDDKGTPQFGLIAEEVAKVSPDVVVYDPDGKPYSVRYDAVNAMLLNEFLKEHRKMEEQAAMIAKQQKQIEALSAGLQKVSAQVEMSKPAPQTVLNQ